MTLPALIASDVDGTLNFDREKGTVTRVIDGVPLELPPPTAEGPPVQLERFTPAVNP